MNGSRNGHGYGAPDAEGFYLGSVRIAHRAVRTMIEQAALQAPGVAGVAHGQRRLALGKPIPWRGIGLTARGDELGIDLYLLAQREANLAQVGAQAREAVVAAVEGLLGMRVGEINIYIQDVV